VDIAMNTECLREQDVMDAVASGRWPVRIEPELRDHVNACAICQDVAVVSPVISAERDEGWENVSVPPSSIVWWRAQIRAREEAARAAARPIAVTQAVAVACLVAAAVALIPLAWPSIAFGAGAVTDAIEWITPRATAVSNAFALVTGTGLPILPFAAVSLLLAPILLYYALTEE
jgi:hypothetical protein